jgi:hypothetical protein
MSRWLGPAATTVASLVCLLGVLTASSGWEALWLLIGVIGFAVETVALVRQRKGDTLSETVWANTRPLYRRVILAAFMVWLMFHFVFG